jgi:nanoRNase/pAp phosphatase (c-di-AMP/oligoRNAs hydrolase)
MHNVHNLKDEQLQRLKDVVAKQKKPWAILVAQVDPDALGSAFGLRLALTGLGVKH